MNLPVSLKKLDVGDRIIGCMSFFDFSLILWSDWLFLQKWMEMIMIIVAFSGRFSFNPCGNHCGQKRNNEVSGLVIIYVDRS